MNFTAFTQMDSANKEGYRIYSVYSTHKCEHNLLKGDVTFTQSLAAFCTRFSP